MNMSFSYDNLYITGNGTNSLFVWVPPLHNAVNPKPKEHWKNISNSELQDTRYARGERESSINPKPSKKYINKA